MVKRYIVFYFLFIFTGTVFGQSTISICSWNIKDLGKSKNDKEIAFIASTIKLFDIVVIQEVVSGYGGPQAVARLADQLNRMGNKWDYTVSEPTSSTANKAERYALIWKTNKVKKIGEGWLESKYGLLIEREPYFCRFKVDGQLFTIANFHAITQSKRPETEIKYFKFLPALYPQDNIIFCGDFNIPQSHPVFVPLREMGFTSALVKQKTSLKQKVVNGEYLASEFDNFFLNRNKFHLKKAGIIHFYKSFPHLKAARLISDHVPIYLNFSVR